MTAFALQELHALELPAAPRDAIARWLVDERYADERPTLVAWLRRAAGGDASTREALLDAFSGTLPIGTGGRRGTCGPGPNRMNTVVLRETAQGLARAMAEAGVVAKVAIVYDTRKDSRRFARVVAEQLARSGLGVVLVDAPRPTPLLSFTVRARGLGAGIVISASHNPPSDNGIKIYGADGAQVVGPTDRALMQAIEAAMIEPLLAGPVPESAIEVLASPAALADVDAPYLAFVAAQGVVRGDLSATGLTVVYTPLHGVGETAVLPVLAQRGLAVHRVAAQAPDGGAFSTVERANPEEPATLALAEAEARTLGADLVIATDPDADRLGALVREHDGTYAFIDGNRLGVLMVLHVLAHERPPVNGRVITTVVTTPLTAAIARAHGIEAVDDLLVGFKHHAGVIGEAPERPCVFATEESHGYLRGNEIRDKDGAIAALLLCEAAAVAKRAGATLHDDLVRAWTRYGYHRESTANLYAEGQRGREAIASLLAAWRRDPPRAFGGLSVQAFDDRSTPRSTGSPTRDLPGNVLVFELDAGPGLACRLVLRPSGTEPKAKVYVLARSEPAPDLEAAIVRVDALAQAVLAEAEARARDVMLAMGVP